MAKEKKKAVERVYTIPLRSVWLKQRRIRRAPRAVGVIREFIVRHTKVKDVKISSGLNSFLWAHGAKKPPGKVKVKVSLEEGVAFARLPEEEIAKKGEKTGKTAVKAPEKPVKTDGNEQVKEIPAEKPKEEKADDVPEKKADEKPKDAKAPAGLTAEEKEAKALWKEAEEKAKKEKD